MSLPSSTPPTGAATFDQLVRDHAPMVWRYLRFLGCRPDQADDLAQETFVAVLDKPIDRFGDAGARAYLRRVAKNAFLKLADREKRRLEVDLDTAEAAYEWFRGDDEGQATSAALDACLAELSAPARHALALRFGEQLDRRAMATRLGMGTDGIKSLLARSYARLRICMTRRLMP